MRARTPRHWSPVPELLPLVASARRVFVLTKRETRLLFTASRIQPVADARMFVMYCLQRFGFSERRAAYAVRRSNHTTARHAKFKIRELIEHNADFKRTVENEINELTRH